MPENRLKVMQIILNLERAGAQEVVRTLSEYLMADHCVPIVCTFEDGPVRRDLEALGIEVEVLGPRRYGILALPWFIADMVHIRRKMTQLVKEYEIDVVQTHLLKTLDFLVLTLRYGTDLHVVLWTIHNVDFLPMTAHWLLKPKRLVHRLLYRLAAGIVSGLIAVSDEVRESIIRQIGPIQNKIITIPNGVDFRRYERSVDREAIRRQLGIRPDSLLIVTVGRLTTQKGHRYLITAAATVASRYPDAHFLFIGEGELKETLQAQAEALGISEHIHFLGIRNDVPDVLAVADLFVLSSLWEGLSIALLEAMASSKPIVATAVSGTTQVMTHGETGLMVPPRDSRALADAIIQLLSDRAQARAIGQAAKQHIEVHYSAQRQADEHLALYRRLLAEATGA
jgi:glycosyltransferase involved in cell wall biosynthesis